MSILSGLPYREITEWGGAWLLKDPPSVDFRGALKSQNVQFITAQVGSRYGFADTGLGSMALAEMAVWYGPFTQVSTSYANTVLIAVTYAGGSITFKPINLATGTGPTISYTAASPTRASLVPTGLNCYVTYNDAHQNGLDGGSIITVYNNSGSLGVATHTLKNLFSPPSTYTPAAPTEPSAGVVTAGTHRYAYLIEYMGGFVTRVSPDSGAATPPDITSFQPIVKASAGSKNVQIVITNTWSGLYQNIAAISIAMTTTANLNQYYIVPGSRQTLVSDGVTPVTNTFNISISDADLSSTGIDATPYLYWLTQTPSGTAPFKTKHLALWGNRMAYLGTTTDNLSNLIDAIYASEPNNFQAITIDEHIIQLPGQRPMVTAFQMGGSNFIVGPHEIWSTTDTGDVPTTWPAPVLVDGTHGTLAVEGVVVGPGNDYAWIADQSGLYLFTGGPIESLPVSFEQTPDWNRINWSAAATIKMKDHSTQKRVVVMVPLDAATSPSHMMTWDYTYGPTSDSVRYSIDALSGYNLGTMDIVQNDLAAQAQGNPEKLELWLGSGSSAPVLRQQSAKDTHPYRDYGNALAIPAIYRTALFPGKGGQNMYGSMGSWAGQSGVLQHHGFHTRIVGAGSLTPVLYDIDAQRSFTCAAKSLSTVPDLETLWLGDLRSELGCVEFNLTGAAQDSWFRVSSVKWYYSPWLIQR